jgi:ribonuclease D
LFTFIGSIEDLAYLNGELLKKPYIGVDTEFRRTSKDNMRLALLQVNDEEEIFLIDAVLIQDPGDSASFLFSESVTKIFHSCKEDLEAIYSWTQKKMVNIFDTQIANSFLDGDFTIGYQGLVEKELGIVLNKNETRSNWLRRPLSDSQLKYAALDVEYLIHIYKEQIKELSESSKLKWHDQDVERLLRITFNPFSSFIELERSITKAQENELLNQFNQAVEEIAKQEKINPTLFFSKKAQKDFLRLVYLNGLDSACEDITSWRSKLIKERLLNILR